MMLNIFLAFVLNVVIEVLIGLIANHLSKRFDGNE